MSKQGNYTPERLYEVLMQFPDIHRYWVAYSGGLDSHVLLHTMVALSGKLPGGELRAVHVDHGLNPDAQAWSRHCRRVCDNLGVPCYCLQVSVPSEHGESPEAAARSARYSAIVELIDKGDGLLTAHHQDDQAETVLLQLMRGGGPEGLAGMPVCASFGRGWLVRPLLGFSRDQLRGYGYRQGLEWVEDQTNLDTGLDRNWLRHEVIPRLKSRWPAMTRTVARSAGHCFESVELSVQLAESDLPKVMGDQPNTLSVKALLQLMKTRGEARCRNVLRVWIERLGIPLPACTHLHHVVKDILMAPWDAKPLVHWGGGEARRYRDLLYIMHPLPEYDRDRHYRWDLHHPLYIPGVGTLRARAAYGRGLNAELCRSCPVTVRFRQGGERCRPCGRNHRHRLKNLFQEQGVVPWARHRIPLIYMGDELAAATGLWVCQDFVVDPHRTGMVIELVNEA